MPGGTLSYRLVGDASSLMKALGTAQEALVNAAKQAPEIGAEVDPAQIREARKLINDLGKETDGLTEAQKRQTDESNKQKKGMKSLGDTITDLSAAFAAMIPAGLAINTAQLAAQVETLDVSLATVGRTAGVTQGQLSGMVRDIEQLGITSRGARNIMTQMIRANLDLSKATDLARVAQNSAVVSMTDTSTALEQMIIGITTAQVEVLRNAGIMTSFEVAYASAAKQMGRTVTSLTEVEKANIRLNAVLTAGEKVVGAYEASMATAGKQAGSLIRLFEETRLKIGEQLLPVYSAGVNTLFRMGEATSNMSDQQASFIGTLGTATAGLFAFEGATKAWNVVAEKYNINLKTSIDFLKRNYKSLGTSIARITLWGTALLTANTAIRAFQENTDFWTEQLVRTGEKTSDTFEKMRRASDLSESFERNGASSDEFKNKLDELGEVAPGLADRILLASQGMGDLSEEIRKANLVLAQNALGQFRSQVLQTGRALTEAKERAEEARIQLAAIQRGGFESTESTDALGKAFDFLAVTILKVTKGEKNLKNAIKENEALLKQRRTEIALLAAQYFESTGSLADLTRSIDDEERELIENEAATIILSNAYKAMNQSVTEVSKGIDAFSKMLKNSGKEQLTQEKVITAANVAEARARADMRAEELDRDSKNFQENAAELAQISADLASETAAIEQGNQETLRRIRQQGFNSAKQVFQNLLLERQHIANGIKATTEEEKQAQEQALKVLDQEIKKFYSNILQSVEQSSNAELSVNKSAMDNLVKLRQQATQRIVSIENQKEAAIKSIRAAAAQAEQAAQQKALGTEETTHQRRLQQIQEIGQKRIAELEKQLGRSAAADRQIMTSIEREKQGIESQIEAENRRFEAAKKVSQEKQAQVSAYDSMIARAEKDKALSETKKSLEKGNTAAARENIKVAEDQLKKYIEQEKVRIKAIDDVREQTREYSLLEKNITAATGKITDMVTEIERVESDQLQKDMEASQKIIEENKETVEGLAEGMGDAGVETETMNEKAQSLITSFETLALQVENTRKAIEETREWKIDDSDIKKANDEVDKIVEKLQKEYEIRLKPTVVGGGGAIDPSEPGDTDFQHGGFTGTRGGTVGPGEFVFDRDAVRNLGLRRLFALQAGNIEQALAGRGGGGGGNRGTIVFQLPSGARGEVEGDTSFLDQLRFEMEQLNAQFGI